MENRGRQVRRCQGRSSEWRSSMKKFIRPICFGLLTAALLQPVLAQVGAGGGIGGRRVQGQGIDYVGESVYDLSKLKAGDKIRVDFVVPDESNSELRAASIWPEK